VKKAGRRVPARTEAAERTPRLPSFLAFIDQRAGWVCAALALVATARIVSTYPVFSYTFDEPAHLACGMEWLEKHTYTYEPQHPPLTRVMTALLPWMAGARGQNHKGIWDEGLAILAADGTMDSRLALARAGNLPFFWMLCGIAFVCARHIAGTRAAVLAVALLTLTPPVLAHAGLATTDMGLTATLLFAVYAGWRWLEEPGLKRTIVAGVAVGLAVLAKFSTLAFLPSIALVALAMWWGSERPGLRRFARLAGTRLRWFPLAAVIAALVIWAGYRFSFGAAPQFSFPVPAPELFRGIEEVRQHDANGHLTYLLGASNTVGWPHFYVVALGVKTPLPLLALGLMGLGLSFSRSRFGSQGWMMPSVVLGILIFASFLTRIKIGTRHVMPVYVALAIAGAYGSLWVLQRYKARWVPWTFAGVLVALAGSSAAAHPDYLAYFNPLAGDRPESVLVDSDLDWSQDVKRVAQRLKEVGAPEVFFNQYAPGDIEKLFGFPPVRQLDVNGPGPGWNAVSVTRMKYGLFGDVRFVYDPGLKFWPDERQPTERIGGILLFYNPVTR
jgi:4-amino-4-deoxy-L-arabinose transferase-like glycosyltransferase